MNIWKRQRREHGDHDVAYRHGSHKHVGRVCVACKNTRTCQTCMGQPTYVDGQPVTGCSDCSYTSVCQECILWAPTEADDD